MTLKSKSFQVYKGDSLDYISRYIEEEIGLDAYLIKDIEAVVLSPTVTQITVLYNKYPSKILDSIAPRQGAIFTSDVGSNDFDVRFLFNYPIDFKSIVSGTFKIDTNEIDVSKLYLDPNSNNYFLKLKVDTLYQSEDFHTYQITNNLKRIDGSVIEYSPVGGYIFHGLSSAHIGDLEEEYSKKKRGKVTVGVLRLSKGLNPQQGISEYLSQRQITNDMLISYTSTSTSETLSDIYIIYFSKLEPQIIGGFPLNNSLLPNVSAPNKVTLVFNIPLDKSVLKNTPNLFTIEEGFTTSTPVDPADITLLSDSRTVEIDVSSYFTAEKVYSIIARPGILGLNGLYKEKPEQWTIHISAYEGTAFTGTITGGSGAPLDAPYILYGSSDPDLDNAFVINFNSGLTGVPSGGGLTVGSPILINHTNNTSNPHSTTAAQVGAPTTSQFTGHTGTSNIHFTQAQISIPSTQISDFNSATSSIVTGIVTPPIEALVFADVNLTNILTGHTGTSNIHYTQGQISIPSSQISDFNSAVGGIITTEVGPFIAALSAADTTITNILTGHTGTSNIHFTQSQISISASQITDLDTEINAILVDALTGLSGVANSTFTGHTGDTSIHYTQGQISIPSSQISDFTSSVTTIIGSEMGPYVAALVAADTNLTNILTGHTGNTSIHFTQGQISIPSSQITDFSEAAQDAVGSLITGGLGISTVYNDAGGSLSIGLSGSLYTGLTGHTGNSSIHFTVGSIDHRFILNIGAYSHDDIDTYINDFNSHVSNFSNPHSVTAAQVGSPTVAQFTGHTGNTNNPHNVTASQIGAASLTGFTGHTGRIDIHYTQSQISIPSTQIYDFGAAVVDALVPYYLSLAGEDAIINTKITGHTGITGIHFTQSEISIPLNQLSDVVISSPSENQTIRYNGSNWINSSVGGGGATELDGLSDVTINAFEAHKDILVYDTGSSAYVNAQFLDSSTITNTLLTTVGGNFFILDITGALLSVYNLNDLSNKEEARKNLKVNYQIQDFLDYSFFSATDLHSVGSTYMYPQYALNFATKNSQGIMFASNGNSTGIGASASMRAGGADSFYLYNGLPYYFKIAMTSTGNCIYRVGMTYSTFNSEDDISNGAYFEYNSSSGNTWYACTASGSSRTKVNTYLTGIHTLDWRWLAISGSTNSIKFYNISGSYTGVTNISTTLPHTSTGDVRPFISCVGNGVAWRGIYIDKFLYSIEADSLPINI